MTPQFRPTFCLLPLSLVHIEVYVCGIRYMLYDLLSATGDIQVMYRGSSGILSVAEGQNV